MKRLKVILIFLCISLLVNSQSKIDLGLFAGTSHYMGDINKERLFYAPSFSAGVFYRYVINPRYAIKFAFTYAPVKGSDLDFNNDYQQLRAAEFRTTIGDITGQFEFNFVKFQYSALRMTYAPYVSGGLGVALMNREGTFSYDFIIPFGVGVKVNLSRRLSGMVQWEFRKTFMDNLDSVENIPSGEFSSKLHNNDWYYIIGIGLSYRINYNKMLCPAYEH